jgi:hypothetical protein
VVGLRAYFQLSLSLEAILAAVCTQHSVCIVLRSSKGACVGSQRVKYESARVLATYYWGLSGWGGYNGLLVGFRVELTEKRW